MQDYQSLALGYAEELSDLKRRCAGLEAKLAKTRGRAKLYRERCRAWETALGKADGLYRLVDRNAKTPEDMARAYGIAYCATVIRKEVEPAYRHNPEKIRRKVLNCTHQPEVEESGE